MSALVTKRRSTILLAVIASAAGAIHCSSDRDEFERSEDGGPPVAFAEASSSETSTLEPDLACSDENKQVYVLTAGDKALYRFDPEALTFSRVGKLACPTASETFSMAIDRRGTAWIEYGDGRIFKVSTIDAQCTESSFRPKQIGFTTFGMGFAKDDADGGTGIGANETLYVAGNGLGRIDTSTMELSLVGPTSLGLAELTGTGAGTLYAFIPDSTRIAQLDKSTGAIEHAYRPDVDVGSAWAFAQWGGDFWLFTAPGLSSSSVTKYSPATDTTTVMIPDTGMKIVGAGVSTCAPTEPPH
jgi:hypothetical protein